MRVLLLKPSPRSTEFGLGPFFQTEPLGLEYVASALARHRHAVAIADLRFERTSPRGLVRRSMPRVVGISCVHVLDASPTRSLAAAVKAADPSITVVVGGHAASMFPSSLEGCEAIDAIACGEGEWIMPALCDALNHGRTLGEVPGLLVRDGAGGFTSSGDAPGLLPLDEIALPARQAVEPYQRHYCCLNYAPVWTVETARGCRHRCKFCSVWEFHGRSLRFHPVDGVRRDFEATGPNVFVVDDTFWSGRDRSMALADALRRAGVQKNWLLVQSRLDTVVEHPELLERWRPLARHFDVFFGFEAPTSRGLRALHKDADLEKTVSAIGVARRLGFGVTGNFIIDPDYTEEDFRELWAFLEGHRLSRVGFTILTPLPGTRYFAEARDRVAVTDWDHYDLHHLIWRPRLPVQRFFELYCETWRRTVLNLKGQKRWWHWVPQVRVVDIPRLARILSRTQRLMDPQEYLSRTAPEIATFRPLGSDPAVSRDQCPECSAIASGGTDGDEPSSAAAGDPVGLR